MMLSPVLLFPLFGWALSQVEEPTFGYHGLEGPLNWYTLNEENNTLCAKGRNQSPINFPSSSCGISGRPTVNINAAPQGAEFVNLGTTVEVEAHGTLVSNGKTYNLAQFHFHTPSEHHIDAKHHPLEVHFVFQATDGARSVIGFFIDIGTQLDSLLGAVLGHVSEIPSLGNTTTTDPLDFSGLQAHFTSNGVFQYGGSLTTPPCLEGVAWVVSCAPLTVDVATYNAVRNVVGFNARYTQNTPGQINLLENIANELNQES